jgi:hypothetical protein
MHMAHPSNCGRSVLSHQSLPPGVTITKHSAPAGTETNRDGDGDGDNYLRRFIRVRDGEAVDAAQDDRKPDGKAAFASLIRVRA